MAIGSAPEIGRRFTTGLPATPQDYGPWVMPDGSTVELQRGEATVCFIAGRPGNIYPPAHHRWVAIAPKELEHDG